MQNESRIFRPKGTKEVLNQDIWSYLKRVFKNDNCGQHMTAYVCSETGKFYTYEQVRRGSGNWAGVLRSLSKDSKPPSVVVLSPTTIEVHVVCLGSARNGSCVHMINYQLPFDVLQELVEQSESDIIVTDISLMDLVESLLAKLKRKFRVFVCGVDSSDDRSIERILQDGSIGADFKDQEVDPESPAFVFFSSGTTGRPKGTMMTHKALVNGFAIVGGEIDYQLEGKEEQRINSIVGNLAHVAPYILTTATIAAGGKAVIIRSYDLTTILKAVKKYEAMCLCTWPSNLDKISKREDASELLKNIRLICSIGMALNSTIATNIQRFLQKGGLKNWYGCTEAGSIGFGVVDSDNPNKHQLKPNTEIRIVDLKSGKDLGPNHIGEIVIRSPTIMIGYFKRPEATKEVLDKEGWLHTGDSGYITEDENIVYFERIKHIIEVNNKRIAPMVIEEALMSHPSVLDAGAIGVADREAGELPHAFVVRATPELSQEELVRHVDGRVKEHERLKGGVSFVDSIPRNHMGKIDRKILKFMSLEKQQF